MLLFSKGLAMEIILIWIVFGVIAGVVAKNKGRSVGGWATASIFLGFLPLIVLAFLKPKASARFVPQPPSSFPGSYGAPGSTPPGRYGARRK